MCRRIIRQARGQTSARQKGADPACTFCVPRLLNTLYNFLCIVLTCFANRASLSKFLQRTTELYTAPHSEVAPFQRVWNPDTNNVYEDPDDWPKESDDDDTLTKDELYVYPPTPRPLYPLPCMCGCQPPSLSPSCCSCRVSPASSLLKLQGTGKVPFWKGSVLSSLNMLLQGYFSTHTHTYTLTHIYTHTHTYTRTHKYTHIYAHTHIENFLFV